VSFDIPAVWRHEVNQLSVAGTFASVVAHVKSIAYSGDGVKGDRSPGLLRMWCGPRQDRIGGRYLARMRGAFVRNGGRPATMRQKRQKECEA
jgi:hypothetical protein